MFGCVGWVGGGWRGWWAGRWGWWVGGGGAGGVGRAGWWGWWGGADGAGEGGAFGGAKAERSSLARGSKFSFSAVLDMTRLNCPLSCIL